MRGLEKQKFALEAKINKSTNNFNKFTKIKLSPESVFDLNIWINLYKDAKHRYTDVDYILLPEDLPTYHVYTDASTSYGAGGLTTYGDLYHLPWKALNISSKLFKNRYKINPKEQIIYLELFALVLMAYINAKKWSQHFIHFWCDNMTVVKMVSKGTIKFSSKLYFPKANLVKLLARLALKYNFHFTCHHIKGKKNVIADALSRKDDKLRHYYYKMFNEKYHVPKKIAQKIVNLTCVSKFCAAIKI